MRTIPLCLLYCLKTPLSISLSKSLGLGPTFFHFQLQLFLQLVAAIVIVKGKGTHQQQTHSETHAQTNGQSFVVVAVTVVAKLVFQSQEDRLFKVIIPSNEESTSRRSRELTLERHCQPFLGVLAIHFRQRRPC